MSGLLRALEAEMAIDTAPPRIPVLASEKMRRVLLAISGLWLIAATLSIWRYTWDDSYIIFRYAQNLADGNGIVFNAGQRVEGYTSFLWVVLVAGASRLSANPVLASKVLGLLFNLAALVAGYFLCGIVSTRKAPMYGVGLLLAACNPHFIVGSIAGLETPLFTALLCWSIFAYLKAHRVTDEEARRRWCAGASLLFALLVMTRPDGALAYSFVWMHAAWKFRKQPRTLAYFTLPFVLVYAPYFLWRWHYYGFLFPNTFYVKRGGTLVLFARGIAQMGKFLGDQAGGWFLSGLIGLAVLLFPVVDTTVPALAIASRVIFELWSGGVTQGEFRFLISALPLIWILAERVLLGGLGKFEAGSRAYLLAAGICAILVVAHTADFIRYRKDKVQPVETGMERAHIALGKWLELHSPPNATIAVGDIGAIGFRSQRMILDLDGLTDTYISHLPGTFGDRHDSPYVLRQSPDFIVLRTSGCKPEPPDVSLAMDKAIFGDPQFQTDYRWAGCWEFWPRYDLVLYQRSKAADEFGKAIPELQVK